MNYLDSLRYSNSDDDDKKSDNQLKMSQEVFSPLRDEIHKFTGFRFPEPIRTLANSAVLEINSSDFQNPISNSSSSIPKFIAALFNNNKLIAQANLIFMNVIKLVQSNEIVDDALEIVLDSLVNVMCTLNNEQAMLILQLTAEGMSKVFPKIPIIESYFSIMLALMAHDDIIISSTAFAYFPQILESLQVSSRKEVPESYIQYCTENYCQIFNRFEKPFNFIFYLLFSDMTNIALKQPMSWLKLKVFPTAVIYDLLELIVNQFSEMLINEPQLICIFDGAVIQAMNDTNALQFIICFIDTFLESHISLCKSLFGEFQSKISARSRQNYIPLFFFRGVATKNEKLPSRLFECFDEEQLFTNLTKILYQFSDPNMPSDPIEFSMTSSRLKSLESEKGKHKFEQNSPYEIIFGFLKSFKKNPRKHLKIWLEHNYLNILKMIHFALKYSTLETFKFPCKALLHLLKLMHQFCESSIYEDSYSFICNLSIEENVPEIDKQIFQTFEKQSLYQRFLCKVAEKSPFLCSRRWLTILNSIFKTKTTLSLDFGSDSSIFDEAELQSITEAAIAISPLPYDFLASLISANMDRFLKIWVVLEPFFKFNLKEQKYDKNVFKLFLELMSRCITSESEEAILSMAVQFVLPDSVLILKHKDKLLSQLRQFLTEAVDVVKNGWTHIFNVLLPQNFGNSVETIQSSFNVLTLICNDHIHLVPQNSMQPLIEVIFKFADSDADINLSLSSFDLLWGVVRIMDNSPENWTFLMSEVLRLIKDNRNDVSQCSIRTFFSLMSSNFSQIPQTVIDMFVTSTFSQILTCIDFKDDERAADFELALQEMAHYTSTFWDNFDKNPAFKKKFVPLLIDKATAFCSQCNNQELVTNAFQLYECLFQCESLDASTEKMLQNSLSKLADDYIKISDSSSIIYPCFGRLLNRVLVSLKNRNVLETLPSWFPMIRILVRNLASPVYVHITVQRALEILPSLFPMPDEIGLSVVDLLVEFAVGNATTALPEYIVNLLCKIFKNGVDKSACGLDFLKKCKSLAMMRCSEPLMKLFLEAKIEFDDSSAPDVFDFYTTISKMWPSLQSLVDSALVLLIDRANEKAQKKFVISNSSNFEILELLWLTFFDPQSEKFNQQVFDNCFNITFGAIEKLLQNSENDPLAILNFLSKSTLPPQNIGEIKNSNKWHLVKLMKYVIATVTSENKEVRIAAKEVLNQISDIIDTIIS
ncbi:hypothetical protein TRFO_25793 [Tritrichomonas foetus]|uniref:Uncharacterized protein n=1 Tax=Tritrichomonas foetus TaxID=1144522 RepID=A0A1J4K5G4_9EUKA|nr:hypothetical protein TRFO_25793 [Tritrichomonas foetus]|eukprot:OHT06234.1 hypothetical protein TRFO_25793 [Tritrichomonas foetus]